MAEHDLVVRNGTVVDGTGATRRVADVAITGGIITAVGRRIDGRGRREIDADGHLVTLGFVDGFEGHSAPGLSAMPFSLK